MAEDTTSKVARLLWPVIWLVRLGQRILLVVASLVVAPIPALLFLAKAYEGPDGKPDIPPLLAVAAVIGSAALFWAVHLWLKRRRRARLMRSVEKELAERVAAKSSAAPKARPAKRPAARIGGAAPEAMTEDVPEDATGFRAWVEEQLDRLGWRVEVLPAATGAPAFVIEGEVSAEPLAIPVWVRAEERSITGADIRGWAHIAKRIGVPVAVVATLDGTDSRVTGMAERFGILTVAPDELPDLAGEIADLLSRREREARL